MDNGMCLFGLCLVAYEAVAMALVVGDVIKIGSVMVMGWFSCRLVCDREKRVFEGVGCLLWVWFSPWEVPLW